MKQEVKAFIASLHNDTSAMRDAFAPDDYYMRRVSHFARLNVGRGDIVMLGDSLINGCEWHELLENPLIKNRGINGDTVEGVRQRVEGIMQGKPAKVFLMVGINDVSHNIASHAIACSIVALVDYLHSLSPGTQVYVHSLLPFDSTVYFSSLTDKEGDVRHINTLLSEAAEEFDYTFIDLYAHFANPDGTINAEYSNDGLHLTGSGYALWARLLQPYINE